MVDWYWAKIKATPSKDTDQPGHPPSVIRVFTVRMKKAWVLSYPLSASKDWSNWSRMPRLIWVFAGRTGHFVGSVVRRLTCSVSHGRHPQFCCFTLCYPDIQLVTVHPLIIMTRITGIVGTVSVGSIIWLVVVVSVRGVIIPGRVASVVPTQVAVKPVSWIIVWSVVKVSVSSGRVCRVISPGGVSVPSGWTVSTPVSFIWSLVVISCLVTAMIIGQRVLTVVGANHRSDGWRDIVY